MLFRKLRIYCCDVALRICIIGFRGFVGASLYKYFIGKEDFQVIGISRENYEAAKGMEFDIIVNAAGQSNKRWAAEHPKENFKANCSDVFDSIVDLPSKKYVYISSIDADKDSEYGRSKRMGEFIVRTNHKNALIIRLGGMVGPNLKKNMVFDILNLGKTFVHPKSEYNYISTEEVAKILHELIIKEHCEGKLNIINIVGEGTISGEEVANLAGVILPRECYTIDKKEIYNDHNTVLKKLGIKVSRTEDTIKKFVRQYKSQNI